MKKILKILLPTIIIGIFLLISFITAFRESLTFDELVNIQEGKNAWLHQTYNIELYHPPLAKVLQTAPIVLVENGLHTHLSQIDEKNIGRSVVICMGVTLLLVLFFVVQSYFGYWQAICALTLLAFEPNTLAFSHIINTDALADLMICICYVLLLSLLLKPSIKKAVFFAISVGLGLSSKMSFDSFFLFSALGLVVYVKRLQTLQFLWNKKYYLFFLMGTSLLVIWATYFFHFSVIVKERKDESRFSARLLASAKMHHNQLLMNGITIAEHQKFPLGDYIALYKNVALAKASPNCFFLGNYYPKCYWYFMPTIFFLKTPIAFLLFLIGGIYVLLTLHKKREKYVYFFIPFAVIFIHAALSGAFPLNRYMLPLYPFAAIVGSYSIQLFSKRIFVGFAGILLLWYVTCFFQTFPHYLSYANELTGYKNKHYLLFRDSNYDWGQSLSDVAAYAKKEEVGILHLSYFGRDNGDLYGLKSDRSYGSYKFPEICAFHTIPLADVGKEITLMSITNWYDCGYYKMPQYKNPKGIVSDSFLLF